MLHGLRLILRHPTALTIALVFAVNGFVFGNWAPRIPEIQARLGLSEGQLGLALLGLPLGAVGILPFVSWLMSRAGAARVTLWASLGCCLTVAPPAFAWDLWTLALALVLLGMGNGAMDVAMNAEATAVEARLGQRVMATFHALYSLGAAVGAGVGTLAAWLTVPVGLHLVLIAALCMALVYLRRATLPAADPQAASGPAFATPSRALLPLAAMAFCVLMTEGAVGDWSAVYLRHTLESGAALAGLGFAGFSLAMTVMRLYGDRLVEGLGTAWVAGGGALLAAGGLGLGLWLAHPYAAILGFTCVGIGYAGLVPILFRAAAQTPGMAPGTNLAAVASAGYVGFLSGPPLIGFAAEAVGLGAALGLLVLGSLLVAGLATRVPLERVSAPG